MEVILGLDGGASKTEVLVVTSNGKIVGHGKAGPCNVNVVGFNVAEREIALAIKQALKPGMKVKRAVLGIAGAGRKSGLDKYSMIARKIGFENFKITTDGFIGLVAATRFKPGVLVSAGTGTIVMGINRRGEIARALGWGYLFDDEGGGFWIGSRLLNRACREVDRRSRGGEKLVKVVLDWYKAESLDQVIERIYDSENPMQQVASLVEALTDIWWRIPTIRRIIEDATQALAEGVGAVVRRLRLKRPVKIYYTGGIFSLGDRFVELFANKVKEEIGRAEINKPQFKPVFGAILYAMKLEGIKINRGLIEKLYLEGVKQGVLV